MRISLRCGTRWIEFGRSMERRTTLAGRDWLGGGSAVTSA